MAESYERRRLQRVKLLEPLAGKIGGQRAFILDISRDGVRLAHQENLGAHGERHPIEFEWHGQYVAFEGTLTYTRMQRVGAAEYGKSVYHSGFNIVSIAPRAADALMEMIAWHVERALDEQKSNARGIPAASIRSFQSGRGRNFVRHTFTAGKWHETHTTEAEQPIHGFTISAHENKEEVEMLRSAWEAGDTAARTVIRKMAELSISRAEGIPTRQYTP